jgi:hypothetical protein
MNAPFFFSLFQPQEESTQPKPAISSAPEGADLPRKDAAKPMEVEEVPDIQFVLQKCRGPAMLLKARKSGKAHFAIADEQKILEEWKDQTLLSTLFALTSDHIPIVKAAFLQAMKENLGDEYSGVVIAAAIKVGQLSTILESNNFGKLVVRYLVAEMDDTLQLVDCSSSFQYAIAQLVETGHLLLASSILESKTHRQLAHSSLNNLNSSIIFLRHYLKSQIPRLTTAKHWEECEHTFSKSIEKVEPVSN